MSRSASVRPFACLAALAALALGGCGTFPPQVLVQSHIPEGQPVFRRGDAMPPQRYVIVYGNQARDEQPDETYTATDLETVTGFLVKALEGSSFVPAASLEESDVVLLVFRGQTGVEYEDVSVYLPGEEGEDELLEVEQVTEESRRANLRKLGLREYDRLPRNSFVREDLARAAEEERYYFVVIALDAPALFRERQRVVKWVTHFSLPTGRLSYREALAALSAGASGLLGRSTDGRAITQTVNDRRLQVILGTPEVIEVLDTPAPRPPR